MNTTMPKASARFEFLSFLDGAALVLFASCASCSLRSAFVDPDLRVRHAPAELVDGIEWTLFLVGDGGLATSSDDPVLSRLRDDVAVAPERTIVVFLGDNVYPSGLPPVGHPQRQDAEETLRAQASVAVGETQVFFIPGNHDHGHDLEGLREQQSFIEKLPGRVRYAPDAGAPGPTVVSFGRWLRLALVDSEWMIDHPSDAALLLGETGQGDKSHLVVAAHHPLASHGAHGGFFTWRDHLFPFTAKWDWAWIPLPGLGSVYPLARMSGISRQDLSNCSNQRYQERLLEWFEEADPLVFAAGHEHALQLLRGEDDRFLVVSGSGTVDRHGSVSAGRDTLFASPAAGFFRLDFFNDGRVRLTVTEVDWCSIRTPLSVWLASTAVARQPQRPAAFARSSATRRRTSTRAVQVMG